MITGDINNFAIHWEVIEFTEDQQWIYGHFSLWVGGQRLGNYDDLTALNFIFGWIGAYLSQGDEISISLFKDIKKEDLISYILSNYLNESQEEDSTSRLTQELSKLSFPLPIDIKHLFYSAFEDWEILLINNLKDQRLIWHARKEGKTGEAYLSAFTVQTTMQQALDEYKDRVAHLKT